MMSEEERSAENRWTLSKDETIQAVEEIRWVEASAVQDPT